MNHKITTITAVILQRKRQNPMAHSSHIAKNIASIQQQLPSNCKLLVVSKYRAVEEIQAAYDAGQRRFAENRVQALMERVEALPSDIEWHLIGHLQTNKVKFVAPFIAMIHAVDSLKLLQEINKEAAKHQRVIPCLLQLHVAKEETKFGFAPQEILSFLETANLKSLEHIAIAGLMAMASNTDNQSQIDQEFDTVARIFKQVKEGYFAGDNRFCELSIGMSSDYRIAINHGSTFVRVGSAVFAQ